MKRQGQPSRSSFFLFLAVSADFRRSNYLNMKDYRVVIGSLPPSTSDSDLKDAFEKFGHLVGAKVFKNQWTSKCTGIGFVVFDKQTAMEQAIDEMDETELGGNSISVAEAPSGFGTPREMLPKAVYRVRCFGVGGGGFGEDCYKCGKPGHFALDCGNKVCSGDGDSRYEPGASRRGSPSTPSPYDRRRHRR